MKVRSQLRAWESKFFSWIERTELIKSMVLPQFLFLFQALPIEVFHKAFLKWRRILTVFVWAKSRPRVGFSYLTRPTPLGGFGFPDFEVYYAVAQLRPIYSFLRAKVPPGWVAIEEFYAFLKMLSGTSGELDLVRFMISRFCRSP